MEDSEKADLPPSSEWSGPALCAAILLFALLAVCIRRTYQYYQFFEKLEICGPTPLPFVGNLHSLWGKDHKFVYNEWQNKYGSMFGVFIPTPVLCVGEPQYVASILNKSFSSFSAKPINPVFKFAPMSDSLLAISGDHWKHVKSLLLPVFSAEKIKQLAPTVRRIIHNLETYLEDTIQKGASVELNTVCRRFAMDLIAGVVFGMDVNSVKNPDEPFAVHANALVEQAASAKPYVEKLPCWLLKVLTKAGFTIFAKADTEYLVGILEKGLQQRRQNGNAYSDFLQLLVESEREEHSGRVDSIIDHKYDLRTSSHWTRKGLTQGEIISNMLMFLFTGYETIAASLCVGLSCLAACPDSQNKLRKQVCRVAEQGKLTFDIVTDLPHLEAIIEESLRVHVPVSVERIVTEEKRVGRSVLPEGLRIKIVGTNLHHNLVFWRSPKTFDPKRFTNLNLRATLNHYALVSFGHGPLSCVGIVLAQFLVGMTLASIVRLFTVVLTYQSQYPPKVNSETEKLEGTMWVKFKPNQQ